jgi:hypothetical protein
MLEGTNSFAWASISNCAGIPFVNPNLSLNPFPILHPTNVWSWQNARGYEWRGLTATNSSDRFNALTNTFRAIGQVMHLLEEDDEAEYYFQQVIDGQTITFPVEFVRENGVWKILEF